MPAKQDPPQDLYQDHLYQEAAAHGGDVWGLSRRLGRPVQELLDLSSSLNPLGPPPGLDKVLDECLPLMRYHPDRQNLDLRQALAQRLDLHPRNLLPGNGTSSVFRLLSRALDVKCIVILAPAFSEFGRVLALTGRHFHYYLLKEANLFGPAQADLDPIWSSNPSCIILSNPLVPSGALADPEVLETLFQQAVRRRTWLVLDESFMDYAPEEYRSWSPRRLEQYPRLLVLRSLTNFWGLAGVRLSYLMAHRDTMARLAPLGDPWSVNLIAQKVGLFCLEQEAYQAQTREKLPVWREAQAQALGELGLTVLPSQASYQALSLPLGGVSGSQVAQACADQGVLIRDCTTFPGCHGRTLRVGVAPPEQRPRLVQALSRALEQAKT